MTYVPSARAALARLMQSPNVDAILCDLMMPEMSGMQFHAELARTLPALAEKVIFVTGGAFTPAARAFLDEVPNPRLDKPFDTRALRAVLRGFVQGNGA